MKPFFIIAVGFLLTGAVFPANAQDIIFLKNGDAIEAKVLEISSSEIRYRRFDHLEGPVYVLPATNVSSIRYENNTQEFITATDAEPSIAEEPSIYIPSDAGRTQNSIVDTRAPVTNTKALRAVNNRGSAFVLNFLFGFGIGSFVQGDRNGGTIGLLGDIVGYGLLLGGFLPKVTYDEHDIPTIDYNNITAGYIGIGVASFFRIFQLIRPFTYANRFYVYVSPAVGNDGQPALTATVNLKLNPHKEW